MGRVYPFRIRVILAHSHAVSRFDELKEFEKIFSFLINLENLKSLDHSDLRDCCTTSVNTFSHDNKSDVELDDLFFELKVLQVNAK